MLRTPDNTKSNFAKHLTRNLEANDEAGTRDGASIKLIAAPGGRTTESRTAAKGELQIGKKKRNMVAIEAIILKERVPCCVGGTHRQEAAGQTDGAGRG